MANRWLLLLVAGTVSQISGALLGKCMEPSQFTFNGDDVDQYVNYVMKYSIEVSMAVASISFTYELLRQEELGTTSQLKDAFSCLIEQVMAMIRDFTCMTGEDLAVAYKAILQDIRLCPGWFNADSVFSVANQLFDVHSEIYNERSRLIKQLVTESALKAMQAAFTQYGAIVPDLDQNLAESTVSALKQTIDKTLEVIPDTDESLASALAGFNAEANELLKAEPCPNQIQLEAIGYRPSVKPESLEYFGRLLELLKMDENVEDFCAIQIAELVFRPGVTRRVAYFRSNLAEHYSHVLLKKHAQILDSAMLAPLDDEPRHYLIMRACRKKIKNAVSHLSWAALNLLLCRYHAWIGIILEDDLRTCGLPLDRESAKEAFKWIHRRFRNLEYYTRCHSTHPPSSNSDSFPEDDKAIISSKPDDEERLSSIGSSSFNSDSFSENDTATTEESLSSESEDEEVVGIFFDLIRPSCSNCEVICWSG